MNSYSIRADARGTTVTITQTGYQSVPADQREAWIRADEAAFPAIADALAEQKRRAEDHADTWRAPR